jgi:hypothetical protein
MERLGEKLKRIEDVEAAEHARQQAQRDAIVQEAQRRRREEQESAIERWKQDAGWLLRPESDQVLYRSHGGY